jgi:hypothetical protein
MRFRFSIRDLLWLTLVVALALGWFVRERQVMGELTQARKWRGVAGALESVLRGEGWELEWYPQLSGVHVFLPNGDLASHAYYRGPFETYEPSAPTTEE